MVQLTVMPAVRSSAWFAHSEPVLQTMLCSSDKKESKFAVEKILSIGVGYELGDKTLRLRQLPFLNIQATKLDKLISWDGATEPLTTCDLDRRELLQIIEQPLKLPYYCNHTQGIDCAVKEVTAAAESVYGAEH